MGRVVPKARNRLDETPIPAFETKAVTGIPEVSVD